MLLLRENNLGEFDMLTKQFTGDIANIAHNRQNLYEGDLIHYMRAVFNAPNIHHGYHGLRHMLHVTWVCYQACDYYNKLGKLHDREMRELLIAALFHDYNHCGKTGDDGLNISNAIQSLYDHLLPEDKSYGIGIADIIRATQFPHADLGDEAPLAHSIIRDADISQAFGVTWVGDIAAGFGKELGKSPIEMLEQQLQFLNGVKFYTDFGRIFYGDEAIEAKRKETQDLIAMLTA